MEDYNNYGDYGEGGFNQDIGNGGFQSEGGGSQRQQLRSTLTPVTIKQIMDATQPIPDGEFQVNNVSLNLVAFVGVVRNIQDITSAILITVEDGTGSIEVRKWVDDTTSADVAEKTSYELNKYVYITGALKEFNGKKNLQHANIKPITDHNQVIYNHLSAISCHLKAQGLALRGNASEEKRLFVKDSSGVEMPFSIQDKILTVIRENTNSMQEGVPVPFISQKLNLTDDVVLNQCTDLVDSGRIYSGYDDSAFLAV